MIIFGKLLKQLEKQLGYKDTEFYNKIDWCRYVGESSVLQKKEEFTVSNLVNYSKHCMKRQKRMIWYFLDNDILGKEDDLLKEDSKVGLKIERFSKGDLNYFYKKCNLDFVISSSNVRVKLVKQ